ncbi:hypothetical protein ZHAS_00012891 [Anopheles sinensis]|uniref:Uncharacterized protein n=1 Tax=Anopheles sinensis TaxID=74873 RepID=A0A084W4B9_ANOSI|nr:hypothetical protein ZHAS_00012891 [Anopheles sinensis]
MMNKRRPQAEDPLRTPTTFSLTAHNSTCTCRSSHHQIRIKTPPKANDNRNLWQPIP